MLYDQHGRPIPSGLSKLMAENIEVSRKAAASLMAHWAFPGVLDANGKPQTCSQMAIREESSFRVPFTYKGGE